MRADVENVGGGVGAQCAQFIFYYSSFLAGLWMGRCWLARPAACLKRAQACLELGRQGSESKPPQASAR